MLPHKMKKEIPLQYSIQCYWKHIFQESITSAGHKIKSNLYHRIFQVSTPDRDVQCQLLTQYLLHGRLVKNTLLDRVVGMGLDPIDVLFYGKRFRYKYDTDGVTDSLHYLFYHDNYVKPWSSEHQLAHLRTKSL